jgi:nitrate/TMAO reductase-like tetraheme cytochrome c subunit
VLGIVLFPVGYLLEKRRRTRGSTERMSLQILIDFTLARHRMILLMVLIVGVLAFTAFAMGSFQAFTAMETNAFCGQVCHKVMNPEYTAYQHTPHAKVKCVECHIGEGVGWYIHAKLSGVRRLTALISGSYARPIPTPIEDMRSAKDTCEECHWSSRFVGYKEKVLTYYTKGEDSPETKLRLLIKIGGADSPFIKGFGIHYHMQGANKVEYLARDRQRQEIAWVKVTRKDGGSTEYNHQDLTVTAEERQKLSVRRMECLDCHNRPAHEFKSPVDAVDGALAAGTLSRALPFVKVRAVKALDGAYETTDAAMTGISNSLTEYYKENYPDVLTKQADLLTKTTAELQAIYKTSFFPEMKAKWSAYPKNIGHRDWPGCFRCHNDKMVSAKGEKVFTDCTKCHLVLAQGKSVDLLSSVNFTRGQAFNHPGYDEQIKEYTKCVDCHTGGADLY